MKITRIIATSHRCIKLVLLAKKKKKRIKFNQFRYVYKYRRSSCFCVFCSLFLVPFIPIIAGGLTIP